MGRWSRQIAIYTYRVCYPPAGSFSYFARRRQWRDPRHTGGPPYRQRRLAKDVHTLWSLGRFHDIRVETVERPEGTDVIFVATPEPQYALHEIKVKPNPFGIQLSVPPELSADQCQRPRPGDYRRAPTATTAATGKPKSTGSSCRPRAAAMTWCSRSRPAHPKVRAQWRHVAAPAENIPASAIDNYAARLTSHYIATGYYDATVTVTHEIRDKEAMVNFECQAATSTVPST